MTRSDARGTRGHMGVSHATGGSVNGTVPWERNLAGPSENENVQTPPSGSSTF